MTDEIKMCKTCVNAFEESVGMVCNKILDAVLSQNDPTSCPYMIIQEDFFCKYWKVKE